MVTVPFKLLIMGSHVSTTTKSATNGFPATTTDASASVSVSTIAMAAVPPPRTIGILSFEVASVLSKLIHLHKSLTDSEISNLKTDILKPDGIKKLISTSSSSSTDDDGDSYLLDLAFAEKLEDLDRIADVVSRLGRHRCTVPALRGFEHVYHDLVSGAIEVGELGFLVKDMESMVKKMERYVRETGRLYVEMEVLSELENGVRKVQNNEESRRVFEQKVVWQRGDVRQLKDVALWNQTYDKIIELMARTVCTLYARIRVVFRDGDDRNRNGSCSSGVSRPQLSSLCSPLSKECNGDLVSRREKKRGGGIVRNRAQVVGLRKDEEDLFQQDFAIPCGPSPGRVFLECLSLSSLGLRFEDDDDDDDDFGTGDDGLDCRLKSGWSSGGCSSVNGMSRVGGSRSVVDQRQFRASMNASIFGSKSRLAVHATPSTVGGSALALHYANVIIVIEKLLQYPHLVGEEARDDLYQMLPTSLRRLLRMSLKSYCKNMAIYDAPLAHDWKVNLEEILRWLAPLAHNMIRWQSERNVEQQQIVTRTNVLLLQTLYFADRTKTEAAICELLVGLNYICRYEHQQNALLDCAGSFDFGDWMEWQSQFQTSSYGKG